MFSGVPPDDVPQVASRLAAPIDVQVRTSRLEAEGVTGGEFVRAELQHQRQRSLEEVRVRETAVPHQCSPGRAARPALTGHQQGVHRTVRRTRSGVPGTHRCPSPAPDVQRPLDHGTSDRGDRRARWYCAAPSPSRLTTRQGAPLSTTVCGASASRGCRYPDRCHRVFRNCIQGSRRFWKRSFRRSDHLGDL